MIIIPGYHFGDEALGIDKHEISLNIPDEVFDEEGFVIPGVEWGKTFDETIFNVLSNNNNNKPLEEQESEEAIKERCWVDNAAMWKNSLIGEGLFEFRYCADEDEIDSEKFNEFDNYTQYQEDISNKFLRLVRWFAKNNPSTATNAPLEKEVVFNDYTVKGIKTTAYNNYEEQEVLKG
jgi:hypothetical protein